MDKKKVLVTFCEAGQGHIVTAEAIAESLEKKYGDKIDVERCYVFRDSPDKSMQKYEQFAINEVKLANKHKTHLRVRLFRHILRHIISRARARKKENTTRKLLPIIQTTTHMVGGIEREICLLSTTLMP